MHVQLSGRYEQKIDLQLNCLQFTCCIQCCVREGGSSCSLHAKYSIVVANVILDLNYTLLAASCKQLRALGTYLTNSANQRVM